MITLYGIRNCDTMKKARKWLDAHGVDYRFHDYKRDGIDASRLRVWVAELGWQQLLNRRGTMWRKLPDAVKASLDRERAIAVMLETPSIIRRPLLDTGDARYLGFSEALYRKLFA